MQKYKYKIKSERMFALFKYPKYSHITINNAVVYVNIEKVWG